MFDGTYDHDDEIAYDLLGGRYVVRVRYRGHGQLGSYRRFTLVPDEGETFEQVCAKIVPAIEAHAAGRVKR